MGRHSFAQIKEDGNYDQTVHCTDKHIDTFRPFNVSCHISVYQSFEGHSVGELTKKESSEGQHIEVFRIIVDR